MVPQNKLSQTQLDILDNCMREGIKHHWIQGFAGSGKTVLLVHSIIDARAKNPELSICAVVYTNALKDLVATGIPDHLSNISVMTYHNFQKNPDRYDMIVVDEVQDLDEDVLKLLVQHCDKLIIAGDEDQSIYENRVSTKDIERIVNPTKYKLVELFRLTKAIRDIVSTLLPKSLIYEARINRTLASVNITLAQAQNSKQEIEWCWQQARKFANEENPSAILLPKHELIRTFIEGVCDLERLDKPRFDSNERGKINYEIVNKHLENSGLNLQYIGNKYGSLAESDNRPLVYLMTYHSAKGLDYETVFLPHLNEGMNFWKSDPELERRLLFVAMTRSRRNLFMSYHTDHPHFYVKNMPQHLLHKIECMTQKQDEDNKQAEDNEQFYF